MKSSRPSDAYRHQWTRPFLLQIVSWRHYLNQRLLVVNWTHGNKFQWNLYQSTNISFNKMRCQQNCNHFVLTSTCQAVVKFGAGCVANTYYKRLWGVITYSGHISNELIVLNPDAPCHICPPLRLCKGTANGLWKTVEIHTAHVSPQCDTRQSQHVHV